MRAVRGGKLERYRDGYNGEYCDGNLNQECPMNRTEDVSLNEALVEKCDEPSPSDSVCKQTAQRCPHCRPDGKNDVHQP